MTLVFSREPLSTLSRWADASTSKNSYITSNGHVLILHLVMVTVQNNPKLASITTALFLPKK